ncbi:MAG: MFS transporter [Deltaproteobacteria bacterium]|nr:MFS transporter [Deltaproteobacteria bacterium]
MRPPRGIRRDLRLSLGDAAGYGAMAGVAEVYLPAFALALGMPPVLAGLVATAPLLAGGLLQLLAPRAIARVTSLRAWVIGCMIVQALSFVPLIIVALIGGPATPTVFASAALYWAAGMGASAGWNPWMARVVPERIRGKFFGRRQGLAQATMLAGLIGAGLALHAAAGTSHLLEIYAAMFAVAFVGRLASALMVSKMGRGIELTPRRRMRLRSIPEKLRGTPRASLLTYLLVAMAAGSISGAFITPYLLDHQGLGYVHYSVFTATIVVSKIVFLPALGRLIQRVGVRRVLASCAIAIAVIPLMYIASGNFIWLLMIQLYGGIAWGGFELGMLMALFDADDDAERTTLQVAFSALQAIGTAGASFIGAALLASLGSGNEAYFWVFVASAIARTLAAALIVRELPRVLVRLPGVIVVRAWTLAIRPWGGTIVRPIVEGLGKLGRRDRD